MYDTLELRAGPRAFAQVRDRGIAPGDIRCVPAAAGGPKGLALIPFDRLLHREWLAAAPNLQLVGASIGACRATALANADPAAALDRLQRAYMHEQNYRERPSPRSTC